MYTHGTYLFLFYTDMKKKKEKEATGFLPIIYEQCMSHVVHLINEPADLADKH